MIKIVKIHVLDTSIPSNGPNRFMFTVWFDGSRAVHIANANDMDLLTFAFGDIITTFNHHAMFNWEAFCYESRHKN
jgi:hypothetical protein